MKNKSVWALVFVPGVMVGVALLVATVVYTPAPKPASAPPAPAMWERGGWPARPTISFPATVPAPRRSTDKMKRQKAKRKRQKSERVGNPEEAGGMGFGGFYFDPS